MFFWMFVSGVSIILTNLNYLVKTNIFNHIPPVGIALGLVRFDVLLDHLDNLQSVIKSSQVIN